MKFNQQNETLIWKRDDESTHTLEVLNFKVDNGFKVKSVVSGMLNGTPLLIDYSLVIDKNWKVNEVNLTSLLDDRNSIILRSGHEQTWYDEKNNEIPELKGCIDIDISITPFTNSLPIKRLGDSLKERTKIIALYFNLTDWKFKKVEQYYTKLSDRLYKYEGVFRNFEADLPVDGFGFVTTYPSLFDRLYPYKTDKSGNRL